MSDHLPSAPPNTRPSHLVTIDLAWYQAVVTGTTVFSGTPEERKRLFAKCTDLFKQDLIFFLKDNGRSGAVALSKEWPNFGIIGIVCTKDVANLIATMPEVKEVSDNRINQAMEELDAR